MKIIDASGFKQKWKLDPKGFFLIRINTKKKTIEVGYCRKSNKPSLMITGKTPEEIIYKIIDLELISLLDHAGYLGKELQKAYFALHNNLKYVQDSMLERFYKKKTKN